MRRLVTSCRGCDLLHLFTRHSEKPRSRWLPRLYIRRNEVLMASAKGRSIGVGVVGCGPIGRLRAAIAAHHPLVSSVVVCDRVDEIAKQAAGDFGATRWTADFEELVADPGVDAVIVSTTEGEHFAPAASALDAGKPTIVEKPLTLELAQSAQLLELSARNGVALFTGYTQRFRGRFLAGLERVRSGSLGTILAIRGSIWLTRPVAAGVYTRAPATTPAVNTMTYVADLTLWYVGSNKPVTVAAAGSGHAGITGGGGFETAWALVTFEDGAIANLGVSWGLPARHPSFGASMDLEVFGSRGVIHINDDHRESLIVMEEPQTSLHYDGKPIDSLFPGSSMPGGWFQGTYFGPMRTETDEFIRAAAGAPTSGVLATGGDGHNALRLTTAIDIALA
ncbi:MAG: Gfo/Idh/MocA family oxidoreductase, partial [Acidimicrobiia bacterium]